MRKKAKKSLGQNFLVSKNHIEKIILAVNPQPEDLILEIGPGRGAITKSLVESGARVIAVELDSDLAGFLQKEFSERKNFSVIHADILDVKLCGLLYKKAKVVGNLPYYVSTAILQKIVREKDFILDCTFMFQKEVADRILAQPKNKQRGFLTVIAQTFLFVEKIFEVPPFAFRPVPKVWSSVVKAIPKEESDIEIERFFDFVGKCFSQKRKTLFNNLRGLDLIDLAQLEQILETVEINKTQRAEALTNEEWKKLFLAFEKALKAKP
ncbi:MAG: 16S rRNA (adenine(1518)-N(6)/adenine(1519)-N(6))-dimethyltransferase RsmA [Pyrinomonadaceae bacterium]|nr:16S rRNA (adenine(1518)-N(6)/adenine(1519)-N(6))-dimethyltransferase RsmA [Pyrinomonadaceae bacterium]MCX7639221.1 16S rRNA (adenine(1518)-N(6)/adenine(1519)-N(6))-dimethyltransferase RsmA [Pyrinomonadaceae bacterium]MDW8303557.1 16S rRNA (adenine(1518)-N(6)/adenine(1519)-N(6))-dimethyltransferase RsmA [Acidobacteriota bacterium]